MDVKLTIPQKWNDLSDIQLQNIAEQLHAYQHIIKDSPDTIKETATRLYYQLAKELLRHNGWKAIRIALREIRPKAFLAFSEFIYTKNDRTKFIKTVTIAGQVYHAPGQRLRNISIGEFSYIDAAYYRWQQDKKPIWLSVLCAAMYREASPEPNDIDIRKPFIKQAVDSRADVFQALPFKTKLAIASTYEGCRNHIADTFPLIFPKPIVIEGEAKPKPKKYISFGEIVLDKIQGDPSKLTETNSVMMYDFLNIITNDLKKQK